MAIRQLITFAFSSFACLTIASAAFGQVPHTFIAGTPARAAEVNENFEYLDDRVSDNVTDIARLLSGASPDSSLVIVDSLENVVGPAVNFSTVAEDDPSEATLREQLKTVNSADVLFKDPVSGKIFRLELPHLSYGQVGDDDTGYFTFTEPNCQGTLYFRFIEPTEGFDVLGSAHILLEDGTFPTPFGKGIYYPTSATPITITIQSWTDSGGICINDTYPQANVAAFDGYVDLEALHPPPYRLAVN